MKKKIYLDHNATTPVRKEVVEAMLPYYTDIFGNASSVHMFGQEARKAVEDSREQIASFIGAAAEEVIFTSGGTESDNFAIKGTAYEKKNKGNHIITSSIEHPAVLNTCQYLGQNGFKITYLAVDKYGLVDPEDVKKAITKETVLITIMHANNEVGTILPVKEIGKIAKDNEITFHTDAVQSTGKIPINVNELNVDMLSMSGHKVYGPKGIGALFIRKGTRIEQFMHGGHHEFNKRAGTENVPGIAGFAKAVEVLSKDLEKENKKLSLLRDKLWNGLKNTIADISLNGHPTLRLPNTLDVSFNYIESESIILNLDLKGIAVSGGSACASGSTEPSHVLTAMGVEPTCAQGAVRFSLGKDNTGEDIDYVLEVLPPIVKKLRDMSPIHNK
ncbi:MAG: cysteine desulfurase NifS [Elusimicrobia bacterium]|nr:cysteine desulfurase NifS [Candidatus Liberimonas magnetica]